MNKKQKDNLIKAFQELNAPDKDVLLQKIESKKALGGDFSQSQVNVPKAIRKRRVAWTSFACSFVVIVIAIILLSMSVFGGEKNAPDNSSDVGTTLIDYRANWSFTVDNKISFDTIDKNMKEAQVSLIYDYVDDWTIVETQITQDESAYREYYVKDGITVEVTVLLKENVASMGGRYYYILSGVYGKSVYEDNYYVYDSTYYVNNARKKAYLIYLEDKVYIFTSDVDMMELSK